MGPANSSQGTNQTQSANRTQQAIRTLPANRTQPAIQTQPAIRTLPANQTQQAIQDAVIEMFTSFDWINGPMSELSADVLKATRVMVVQTFRLSCQCDPFVAEENFIGIMIYSIKGRSEVRLQSGRLIKGGYVFIKNTKNLKPDNGMTMHATCARSLLGQEYSWNDIAACGFAYSGNGDRRQWTLTSGTYNGAFVQAAVPALTTTDSLKHLGAMEQVYLTRVLELYENQQLGVTLTALDCIKQMLPLIWIPAQKFQKSPTEENAREFAGNLKKFNMFLSTEALLSPNTIGSR